MRPKWTRYIATAIIVLLVVSILASLILPYISL